MTPSAYFGPRAFNAQPDYASELIRDLQDMWSAAVRTPEIDDAFSKAVVAITVGNFTAAQAHQTEFLRLIQAGLDKQAVEMAEDTSEELNDRIRELIAEAIGEAEDGEVLEDTGADG